MKSSIKIKKGQIEDYISDLTQEGLDSKFNNPSGTTEQVVLGDGTLGPLPSGSTPTWGAIIGDITDQIDLQNALDSKFDNPTGTSEQVILGDGSLGNFPTPVTPTWGSITGTLSAQTDLQIALNNATTADTSTGLYALNEGNGIGWRYKGKNPAFYGNIGLGATDISTSDAASSTLGATGLYSFANGYRNTASGEYSIAFGRQSQATGQFSMAFGFNTRSQDTAAVAMGNQSQANGTSAFAMGETAIAEGAVSTSIGRETQAFGSYSTAIGSRSRTWINYSTAIGTDLNAYANYSTVFGVGNNVHAYGDTVIGTYALTLSAGTSTTAFQTGDTAFRVGIGTSAVARKDAFQVQKSGLVFAPNTTNELLALSGSVKALTTREYVDSKASPFASLDEGNGIGFIVAGRDPLNYGNIGLGAFDITTFAGTSATRGATGQYSFAQGLGGTASGQYSAVFGQVNTASGVNAFCVGSNNTASQSASSSLGGNNNTVAGVSSVIIGGQLNGTSGGYSAVVAGQQNTSSATNAVTMGMNNTSATMSEVVIGQFAAQVTGQANTWNVNDTVFRIGMGTSTSLRADALRVYKNGTLQLTKTPNVISGSTQVLTLDASNNVVLKDDGRKGKMIVNPSTSGTVLIPHGLGVDPTYISVTMGDQTSPELREYTITTDATNIILEFLNTPSETMLQIWWSAEK